MPREKESIRQQIAKAGYATMTATMPAHLNNISRLDVVCAADQQQSRRRLVAVTLCVTVVRVLLLELTRRVPFPNDAVDYVDMANRLVSGQHFIPYSPPGVPLFLAIFAAISSSPVVLRACMLIFWLLASWAFWRLMCALRMESCAWLLWLVWSLLPDSMLMSIEPLSQIAMTALLLVALSSVIRITRGGGALDFWLLGLSLGAAALTRPSALPLILVLPLIAVWKSRRWAPAAASVLLAFALVGAWMLHVHHTTGHAIINSSNSKNLFYGNNPWTPDYKTWYFGSHAKGDDETEFLEYQVVMRQVEALKPLEASARFQALARHEILTHPLRFAWRTSNRVRCFWGFDTFAGSQVVGHHWMHLPLAPIIIAAEAFVYLVLLLPAVYWLARARGDFWRHQEAIALATTIILYALPYWLSMSHPTYHFPVFPLVVVLGAIAWRDRRRAGQSWRGIAAVAIVLLVQLEWVWQMSRHTP
ncbi:MAG: hypothetical protein V4555_03990 [Acidobacteriota bacterium]